jgi:hypothetical protein
MNKKKIATGDESAEGGRFAKWVKVADMVLKLTPALATCVAAWIAYDFQTRSAGISMLNQREQAETQLRASMFDKLISPIAGPNRELNADQERVLAELLTLNFHEHIEFKPLLLHADKRLATAPGAARDSLRSVVRRVRDRQLALLQKDCAPAWAAVNRAEMIETCREEPVTISFCEFSDAGDAKKLPKEQYNLWLGSEQCTLILPNSPRVERVFSPDAKYNLTLSVVKSRWEEQSFDVTAFVTKDSRLLNDIRFEITPFDLPFTDNTILGPNNRFALVIKDVEKKQDCTTQKPEADGPNKPVKCDTMNLWVVWFPPRYILPHERPVNFQDIRKILDLDSASR